MNRRFVSKRRNGLSVPYFNLTPSCFVYVVLLQASSVWV